MKRVERVATIATPPDELFAYLADLENLDQWMAGIVSAEVTSPAEIGVGTTARVIRALGSQSDGPPERCWRSAARSTALGTRTSKATDHRDTSRRGNRP